MHTPAEGTYGSWRLGSPPLHHLQGKVDATWIFEAWEGVLAKQNGVQLNAFRLSEHQVPYGYSPLLLAAPALLQ